jgi:hypothetical protein
VGTVYYSAGSTPPTFAPQSMPEKGLSQLWRVGIESGDKQILPLPARGTLQEVAYDRQGRPTALTEDQASSPQRGKLGFLIYHGRRIPIDPDLPGSPVLVHAFRLVKGRGWLSIETKASSTGDDLSPGVRQLAVWRNLSTRSTEILSPHTNADPVESTALLHRLLSLYPNLVPGDKGRWADMRTAEGSVVVWEVFSEFSYTTGRILFLEDDRLIPPPQIDYKEGDIVAVMLEDPFLLVAGSFVGSHPRLYDVSTHQLVYASDLALAVTYWPPVRQKTIKLR